MIKLLLTRTKCFALCISVLLLFSACGDDGFQDGDASASNLELTLIGNTTWPIEVVGILDIVEAGDYEDSDYPSWAVGSLVTAEDEFGVGIEIGKGVVSRAKINIDSGKEVRVWLEAPVEKYGIEMYPVSRIQSL